MTVGIEIFGDGVVGVVLTTSGGEIAGAEVMTGEGDAGTEVMTGEGDAGTEAVTGEGEIAGMEVVTGEGDAGMEVVEILRVQAVNAIDPIPIINLKYFTLNLNYINKIRDLLGATYAPGILRMVACAKSSLTVNCQLSTVNSQQ